MGSDFPDLSLDLSPPAVSRPDPDFLTRFQIPEEVDYEELQKVNDFIDRLEDEVKKIKAFKRELPLSFLLLTDAIGKLKDEARKQEERRKEGKLDELAGANMGNDQFEKKSWMSSAQLWSPRDEDDDIDQNREWQFSKYRGEGGAFPSFKESSGLSPTEEGTAQPPALSLLTPGPAPVEPGSMSDKTGGIIPGSVHYTAVGLTTQPHNKFRFQTDKKRRRCWSPELHRRFVEALEKLGGSQVATPKQIRELMQVDGLTNDEVKSHLQKYRLHVRKLPASSRTTPSSSNDIAMRQGRLELSGSKMDLLHSTSPEGPLHLGRSGKCNSTSIEDQHNDNDDGNNHDNSEGHSWNLYNHI